MTVLRLLIISDKRRGRRANVVDVRSHVTGPAVAGGMVTLSGGA